MDKGGGREGGDQLWNADRRDRDRMHAGAERGGCGKTRRGGGMLSGLSVLSDGGRDDR